MSNQIETDIERFKRIKKVTKKNDALILALHIVHKGYPKVPVDTKENWERNNPIFLPFTIMWEEDTNKCKFADVVHSYNELDYLED